MALDVLLTSNALRRLVVHFAVHPDQRLHFRALQRHLELSRQSLRNSLDQLASLGLIRSAPEGQRVLYEPADHPGWSVLRQMVMTFEDPAEVLRHLLRSVPGVRAAFVFGSAAEGSLRPDSDIDLFVIEEEVDDQYLARAIMDAGITLGRAIDVKRFTTQRLDRALEREGTSYLRRVLDGPKRWVIGSPEALRVA